MVGVDGRNLTVLRVMMGRSESWWVLTLEITVLRVMMFRVLTVEIGLF